MTRSPAVAASKKTSRDTVAIKKTVLTMLRTHLSNPYPTYRKMSNDEKETWLKSFAVSPFVCYLCLYFIITLFHFFFFGSKHTTLVRAEFNDQCKNHFKNHMHKWKKEWKKGNPKPEDLNEDVWIGFKRYWSSAAVEKVSGTNSKNRMSQRGGYGPAVHNNGSQTFDARAAQLTEESGGVPPNHLSLMRDTHTNKQTCQIQDKRICAIVENVEKKKSDRLSQLSECVSGVGSCTNELSRDEINRLAFEETTVSKKGSVFGLGRGLESQFSASMSSDAYRVPELVERIELMNDKMTKKDEEMAELKSTVEYLRNIVSQHFPPPTNQ